MDERAMLELIGASGIGAIVDATHPYAAGAHATAQAVAKQAGIPCVTFAREGGAWDVGQSSALGADPRGHVGRCPTHHFAADHRAAAAMAFSFGRPVLLTTGANNLAAYAEQARCTSIRLVVRVLPREESLSACREAGVAAGDIIAARGPFSVEQNLRHIDEYGIGTLVTKDSGREGGVEAKVQAAAQRKCEVVVVERPPRPEGQGACVSSIPQILERLRSLGL